MTEPSVCAIMLTANRPAMAGQAVECFRRQTYRNKRLLIWDNGTQVHPELESEDEGIFWVAVAHVGGRAPIGELRNSAIRFWTEFPIIIHWDSDDYNHPNRITEQVALLQSSGADCVGYNEMLFWREPSRIPISVDEIKEGCVTDREAPGEAWLYSQPNPSYALGTSLAYWRKTWERKLFEATSVGEDLRFTSGLKVAAVSSIPSQDGKPWWQVIAEHGHGDAPRMIARIHSGNTSNAYRPEAMARASEWKRVPVFDTLCREVFSCNQKI